MYAGAHLLYLFKSRDPVCMESGTTVCDTWPVRQLLLLCMQLQSITVHPWLVSNYTCW